jgi:pyruvate, water dikinase
MVSMVDFFTQLFSPKKKVSHEETLVRIRRRYVAFKGLLQANAKMADAMARLNTMAHSSAPCDDDAVQSVAIEAYMNAQYMVRSLNSIASGRYEDLSKALSTIGRRIEQELLDRGAVEAEEFTLPLSEVSLDMSPVVGGKSAHLGDMCSMSGLPVPQGFAITTKATCVFLEENRLAALLVSVIGSIEPTEEGYAHAARRIQEAIKAAPLPAELEQALAQAWQRCLPDDALIAVRSSAVGEDGVLSFAGVYDSVIGVRKDMLGTAFKTVLASAYSPRALAYRMQNGVPPAAVAMGMCCQQLIDAVAAGVAYSRHPVDLRSTAVMVNGAWGLGETVADGIITPDIWLVARDALSVLEARMGEKHSAARLVVEEQGAVHTALCPLSEKESSSLCLAPEQVADIARAALALEDYYHAPQDIEWALDAAGQLWLLQSRPMTLHGGGLAAGAVEGLELLVEGADIASGGVGSGTVVHLNDSQALAQLLPDSVLVLDHPDTRIISAVENIAAVLVRVGSPTGHMASLCREFHLPTLMNIPNLHEKIAKGALVTVDAGSGCVYAGLSENSPKQEKAQSVPACLRNIVEYILPLHLIDPASPTFAPKHCLSLHDIMRFAHERSYREMFRFSDAAAEAYSAASELRCSVPFDLHVIDLGGGLANPEQKIIAPEDITSKPFQALLGGMLNPAVRHAAPRPVNLGGFMSVMQRSVSGGHTDKERFGARSYAIISDRYCNFSSRVGYHYAVTDCWCGQNIHKNYITFHFAGGAADDVRRERRTRCIGKILDSLGFTVTQGGDRLNARLTKREREEICQSLDQLGRLLIVSRQMDMLMSNESMVEELAGKFMRGEYF